MWVLSAESDSEQHNESLIHSEGAANTFAHEQLNISLPLSCVVGKSKYGYLYNKQLFPSCMYIFR